jgi:hypothetical protein
VSTYSTSQTQYQQKVSQTELKCLNHIFTNLSNQFQADREKQIEEKNGISKNQKYRVKPSGRGILPKSLVTQCLRTMTSTYLPTTTPASLCVISLCAEGGSVNQTFEGAGALSQPHMLAPSERCRPK